MFTNIKAIFIGLGTLITVIFGFLYKRRGDKIDEQDKVINAKDVEIKTNLEVHESEIAKFKLQDEIKETNNKLNLENIDSVNQNIDKIKNTKDGEEYEVKL